MSVLGARQLACVQLFDVTDAYTDQSSYHIRVTGSVSTVPRTPTTYSKSTRTTYVRYVVWVNNARSGTLWKSIHPQLIKTTLNTVAATLGATSAWLLDPQGGMPYEPFIGS
jgi:hypothetical protein